MDPVGIVGTANIEQYVRCIRLVPKDGDLIFLSLEEASCKKNLKRVLCLRYEPGEYTEEVFPTSYYKVWVRSEGNGHDWNRYRMSHDIKILRRHIQSSLNFRKPVIDGVKGDTYIDAVIMKFVDSDYIVPISMQPDDPMISIFTDHPSIIKWLNVYEDKLAPK